MESNGMNMTYGNGSNREANYDLLRIISTIAVIVIHISGFYKDAITDCAIFGHLQTDYISTIDLYNTLSRFAVPCFMMLSGAFLLANDRNADYGYFYSKSFKNIGIPTIIFTILYFLYSEAMSIAKVVIRGDDASILFSPIKDVLVGAPFYHMWYLYTLIIVYILIPVIVKVRMELNHKKFTILSWSALVISIISGWTSSFAIQWSISKGICYIGYLLVGYEIRCFFSKRKSNIKATILILAALFIELILSHIQYTHSIIGLAEADEKYSLIGNFNPLVALGSIIIFAAFSQMSIKGNLFTKMSNKSFEIYLIHAGVVSILSQVVKKIDGNIADCRIIIPIWTIIVFFTSLVLANIYVAIMKRFNRKNSD